jgi:YHS domain-containing protein
MKATLLIAAFLLAGLTGKSQDSYKARTTHFNIDKYSVAIQGYDPVSYFEAKPVKGVASIFTFYKGIRYEFATQAHLQAFKTDPAKYEPAYGGWCAYAMGKNGEKVSIDPMKYKIINNHLYLFYYSFLNNTLEKWNEDEAVLKRNADKNWSAIFN